MKVYGRFEMENSKPNHKDTAGAETEDSITDEALRKQVHAQSLKVLKSLPAIGPVVMLYLQSPHRRYQFISDLEWLLLPPLLAGQCKLYMKKEYPISFASWALLDESAEKRLLSNGESFGQKIGIQAIEYGSWTL